MKDFTKHMIDGLKIIVLAVVLAVGLQSVSAATSWRPAAGPPPGNNTEAPINEGATGQLKIGGLTVGTGNPSLGFEVNGGAVRFTSAALGTPSDGYVLKSDGTGNVKWGPDNSGSGGPGGSITTSCAGNPSGGFMTGLSNSAATCGNPAAGGTSSGLKFLGFYTNPSMNVYVPSGATQLIITASAKADCKLASDAGSGVEFDFMANGSTYATLAAAAGNNNGAHVAIAASATGVVPVSSGSTVSLSIMKRVFNAQNASAGQASWETPLNCPYNTGPLNAYFYGYTVFAQ